MQQNQIKSLGLIKNFSLSKNKIKTNLANNNISPNKYSNVLVTKKITSNNSIFDHYHTLDFLNGMDKKKMNSQNNFSEITHYTFDQAYSLSKQFEKRIESSKRQWILKSRESKKKKLRQQLEESNNTQDFGLSFTNNNFSKKVYPKTTSLKKEEYSDIVVNYYRKKYKNFTISPVKTVTNYFKKKLEYDGMKIQPWVNSYE